MADSLRLGGEHPEADLLKQFPYLLFLVYGIYSGASLPPSWILNVFNIGRREGMGRFNFPHWENIIYDFEENLDEIVEKQSEVETNNFLCISKEAKSCGPKTTNLCGNAKNPETGKNPGVNLRLKILK